MGKAIFAALLVIYALGANADAPAPPVLLSPGLSAERLETTLRFRLDDGRSTTAVLAAFRRGEASRTAPPASSATSAYQPVWAHLRLRNTGDADPDAVRSDVWRLVADTYGLLSVETYVVRAGGQVSSILSYAYDEPFDPAERSFGRIISEAVALDRGETADVLVRLRFGPDRRAELRLLTPDDMREQAMEDGLGLAAFYAFSLSMLLFFFGFHLSLNNAVGLAYSGLFAMALLFVAYIDGFGFQFVYPNAPDWHLAAGVLTLNALSASGFWVAGRALQPTPNEGDAPPSANAARLMRTLALAPAAAAASLAAASQETAALLSYLCAAAMFCAHVYVVGRWGASAASDGASGRSTLALNRAAALLTAGAVLALLLISFSGWSGAPSSPVALKLLFAVTGLISMSALTASLVDLRRRHQRAVADRIDALEAEATEARRRLAAERAYAAVRDLAERRARALAEASHDIRQPLASLRLRMSAAAERLLPSDRDGLRQALDHLDALSQHYLEAGRPETAAERSEPAPQDPEVSEAEAYPVSIIIAGLRDMFEDEAAANGASLRCVLSSVETRAPPLALMRIVSNLVSNALKHANGGKVLVGVRRGVGGGEIWVADQGVGMSAAQLDRALRPYEKGATSEGEGLGLAICSALAEENELAFRARSTPGRGTLFRLSLTPEPSEPRSLSAAS